MHYKVIVPLCEPKSLGPVIRGSKSHNLSLKTYLMSDFRPKIFLLFFIFIYQFWFDILVWFGFYFSYPSITNQSLNKDGSLMIDETYSWDLQMFSIVLMIIYFSLSLN